MQRLTFSVDDDLAEAFEGWAKSQGYANRSEAFRDLLRAKLGEQQLSQQPKGPCVATLSFVYDHHARQLAMRLADMQHEHHELTVSSMHAHLDHHQCIETLILRGQADAVRALAQQLMAQPGVTHGALHVVPIADHGHPH